MNQIETDSAAGAQGLGTNQDDDLHRPESSWRRLLRDRVAVTATGFLLIVTITAVFAPWLSPHDPHLGNLSQMLKPIGSPNHLLGTDAQGRDILSRVFYGSRLTLLMGMFGIILGGSIGGAMGILSGFYPWVDKIISRVVDSMLSFPAILFAMALVAITGPGTTPVIMALAFATVPGTARIARSSAVVIIRQEYMEGGRAIGLSNRVLIWRYLTLNCVSTIFVYSTLRFGQIILLGAVLSFLGMGAQPPTAELGMMASMGRDYLFMAPHISTVPSLVIFMIVLALNLVGDVVRDILDPRLRQ